MRVWGEYVGSGASADAAYRGYPGRAGHVRKMPGRGQGGGDAERAAWAQVAALAGRIEEALEMMQPRLRLILRQRYVWRLACHAAREDVRLVGRGGGRMSEREYRALRALAVELVGNLLSRSA